MIDPVREMEMEKKMAEEARIKSEKRAKHREAAQTQRLLVTVVRGEFGFGLGIAGCDGHCLVHRLLRVQYAELDEESSPDSKKPWLRGRLKLGDRIVKVGETPTPGYAEAIEAIQSTQKLLVLEVKRDPDYPEQRVFLRDRLWNKSIAWFRVAQGTMVLAGVLLLAFIVWLALQEPTERVPMRVPHFPDEL